MTPLVLIILAVTAAIGAGIVVTRWSRERDLQHWLPAYLFPPPSSGRISSTVDPDAPLHVFLALCDHYEPETGRPAREIARQRVSRWVTEYPRLFEQFRDSDGRPPQHTFFFPEDEYAPEYLDGLARLCAAGFGDVDVHLHHDGDTAAALHEKLAKFRETLFHRHGLLRRDPHTGRVVYGFIHGNWALCNSRLDRRWCGVDEELAVLLATGCYADFTMPSAPSETQTATMNSIYYACNIPGQPKSHDRGVRARVGQTPPADHLLLVQGPLLFDWSDRKFGLFPRIENGDVHSVRPASWKRMELWLRAGVHVAGRPDWKFIKLHTHGCKDGNIDTLLGPDMQAFHQDLAWHARRHPGFRFHYVTAWEMAQLVHQAEAGRLEPCLPGPQACGACCGGGSVEGRPDRQPRVGGV
jgi:hypothetical protein